MTDKELINHLNSFVASPDYLVEYDGVRIRNKIKIINIVTGELSCTDFLANFRRGTRFFLSGLVENDGFEKHVTVKKLNDFDWRNETP